MSAAVALICEPQDGGAAENVRQLALGLGAHGYEPYVIAPPGFAHGAELAAAGTRVCTVPFRRDYHHPHDELAALRAVRRAITPDVTLVHTHAAKAGVIGRIAAHAAGVPAVYTPHLFPFDGEVTSSRRWFGLVVERLLASWTAGTICVCWAEREVAVRARVGTPARLAMVHNGAELAGGSAPHPVLTRMRAAGPLVGAVTALRWSKGLDVFVRAVPSVLAEVPEARVVIVGNGPERSRLTDLAHRLRLDDEPRFALLPYSPPMADNLAALDVFVLPSRAEAFPIGILEAMASGLPIVATSVGGVAEAVSPRTGRLVPPEDPAALAAAVVALLRDAGLRASLGAAARSEHRAKFMVQRMVAETAAVYDRIRAEGAMERPGTRTREQAG